MIPRPAGSPLRGGLAGQPGGTGAHLEGVLRHHRPSTVDGEAGRPRDTALYAITDDEWPDVRRRLLDRLGKAYGRG